MWKILSAAADRTLARSAPSRAACGAAAVLASVLLVGPARAQCGYGWQSMFGTSDVHASALLPDGDVIFSTGRSGAACSVPVGAVGRLNPTARAFADLGLRGADCTALLVLPGGEVVAGGAAESDLRDRTGRPLGSLALYSPSTGWSSLTDARSVGDINALAVLPTPGGQDLIVGGRFSSIAGVMMNGVARYDAATGAWSSLGSGVTGGNSPAINALAVLPGGDVIVGGTFTTAGGVAGRRNIARFSPSTGLWSSLGDGTNGPVRALLRLPDGGLVVGGSFSAAGGVAGRRNIARYDPELGAWSSLGAGTNGPVHTLALHTEEDVLVGGSFTTAGGVPGRSRLARVNPATGAWGFLGGAFGAVHSLTVVPGREGHDEVFVGGESASDSPRCLDLTTGVLRGFGVGSDHEIHRFLETPEGDVYIGGDFDSFGGVPSPALVRYDPTSGEVFPVGLAAVPGFFVVHAIAMLPGGDLLVGGRFDSAGGVRVNNITRYDPRTGAWSALGAGTNGMVRDIVVLPDGDVLVGGWFGSAGRLAGTGGKARYNPTTGRWAPVGGGSLLVDSFTVLPGGDVIALGDTQQGSGIVRYNPTTGAWTTLGSGVVGSVQAACLVSSGDVLVAGRFSAGGLPLNAVARYSPTTDTWSAPPPALFDGACLALTVIPRGQGLVVAGGNFTTVGGLATGRLAVFSVEDGVWSTLDPSPVNGDVGALVMLRGGDLLVGGTFTSVNTATPAYGFGRFYTQSGDAGILVQPSPGTACSVGTSSFSVTAYGFGTLHYEWLKDGVPIDAAANPSAATSTLRLSSAGPADAASYSCTVSDGCNRTATSLPARLTICAADFNCDGLLDALDYAEFVDCFGAGTCAGTSADLDRNGFVDLFDYLQFVESFEAGCV